MVLYVHGLRGWAGLFMESCLCVFIFVLQEQTLYMGCSLQPIHPFNTAPSIHFLLGFSFFLFLGYIGGQRPKYCTIGFEQLFIEAIKLGETPIVLHNIQVKIDIKSHVHRCIFNYRGSGTTSPCCILPLIITDWVL